MADHCASARRFFLPALPPEAGKTVALPPAEAHHAAGVLRLGAGAAVELFDGRGGLARGAIDQVRRGEVSVMVSQLLPPRPRPSPLIHLGFAQPKGNRLAWLLEKAAELGAASLRPVRFARSVAGRDERGPSGRERWMGHCIAAAKQCGLDYLPEIVAAMSLPDFLAARRERLRILGDPGGSAMPPKHALANWREGEDICLLIGPEGGLTDGERAEALAAGFIAARLGTTTLRVETAAIALLAATIALCEATRLPHEDSAVVRA